MNVTVRQAIAGDAQAVQELRKNAWRKRYINEDTGVTKDVLSNELATLPVQPEDIKYYLENILAANPKENLVAILDGTVIGVVFYETLKNGAGDIGVFIADTYNDKGVGDALLERLISQTHNDLEVSIFARNPSRTFYKKHGFVEEGKEHLHEFRRGVSLPIQKLVLHR